MRTHVTAKRQFFSAFVIVATLICLTLLPTSDLRSEDTKPAPLATKTDEKKASAKVSTVELTIDYGDGMQKRYPTLPWKDGMTVFDALTWAEKHRGESKSVRGGKEAQGWSAKSTILRMALPGKRIGFFA